MLTVRTAGTIAELGKEAWNALDHGPAPVLEHGFLLALEESGSIGAGTGWDPVYITAWDGKELVGAVAAFDKTDSYGEYIFDWAWARASQRAGIAYYPKLVIAAPFTPVTGRRLLIHPGVAPELVAAALIARVREVAEERRSSSIHWLFTTPADQALLCRHDFLPRTTYQFHWKNRGYHDFDEFLSGLTSRRRKQIKKERARAREGAGPITWLTGQDLSAEDLRDIDAYYRGTVALHGGYDYLRPGFFQALQRHAPERMLFARCADAGALFYHSEAGLYGRYWGSRREVPCLHFELAYYAAIERAISQKTPLFEAGAQGEHKLLRGLEPAKTHSAHHIFDPRLGQAIGEFLAIEAREVELEMQQLANYGPYQKGAT